MTHAEIWMAIDRVAARLGLSTSGLAKLCGLDATAFNPSKRCTQYGQPRWLSSRTISLVIEKSGLTPTEFFELGGDAENKLSL